MTNKLMIIYQEIVKNFSTNLYAELNRWMCLSQDAAWARVGNWQGCQVMSRHHMHGLSPSLSSFSILLDHEAATSGFHEHMPCTPNASLRQIN